MPEPAPFLVRRDGTVVHRAAGHVIGEVWIEPGKGWVGTTTFRTRLVIPPISTRKDAARAVWETSRALIDGTAP